jgi:hypothetical protein
MFIIAMAGLCRCFVDTIHGDIRTEYDSIRFDFEIEFVGCVFVAVHGQKVLKENDHHSWISTMHSTSVAILRGKALVPTADRACLPTVSPNT